MVEYSKRQKAIILYLSSRRKLSVAETPGKQVADHLQISLRTLQNEIAAINRGPKGPIISSSNRGYSLNKEAINSLHLSPRCRTMMRCRF